MTFVSNLARFNCTLVWMVSILPLIFSYFCYFSKLLGDYCKGIDYKWYHCHLNVLLLLQLFGKI